MHPMEQRIREYELLYIIPATYTDEEIGTVEGTVKALLEKNGASILSANRLGKFRFAYPIKHVRHGHYILVRLNADAQAVASIDMALRIASEVLRHFLLRADEVGGTNFEMVQFMEVNIDVKDAHLRRRASTSDTQKNSEDLKSGVAALEKGLDENKESPKENVQLSDEELEKKIESALKDETT